MVTFDRREFLGLTGALALGVVAGCSSGAKPTARRRPGPARAALPAPRDAPFDTVVVVMMENRSFDHFLGWLPGADGRQAGLSFRDTSGGLHPTYALAPDFHGCRSHDPKHDWRSSATQYADGACSGFLQTQPVGDTFPVGYYTPADLPVTAALARGHTVLDRYFCSVMGPTWPNRLYQWCATTDLEESGVTPGPGDPRPSQLQTAIFDRVRDAGLTGGYYHDKEPMSFVFASKKYDAISRSHDEFFAAAGSGTLPNVTFLDPDLGTLDEFTGTGDDDHPYTDVRQGEVFLGRVYEALAHGPQWDRTVLVLNFDEHGGFYDHVPPPRVADDTVLPGPGPHPDLKRLGFRVPCIVMGPFAPARVEHAGPYEHCSILRMIEWRWGLAPMSARDANARNLAEVLDLSRVRRPVALPSFDPGQPVACTADDVAYRVAHGGI